MKKVQLLFIAVAIAAACFTQQANAKIWRVNNLSNYNGTTLYGDNFGGTSLNPVFKQLTEVAGSGSVLAGDTIYVEGSPTVYNAVTLRKKLIIIGAGYYLNQNPNTSANLLPSEVGAVTFNTGSEGSQLIGMTVTGNIGIDVLVSNITIKRCRILYSIGLVVNTSDIIIEGNFFEGSSTNSAITIGNLGAPANVIVNNNIFQKVLRVVAGSAIITFQECKNNVFDCPVIANNPSLQFNCALFKNNILKTPGASVNINGNPVDDPTVSYNFSASASGQFGTVHNNAVVDMNALFVNQTGVTPDGKYQLKPGSSVGSDGTERGAFGGAAVTSHYTLSGLANIPVVYTLTTSGVTSTDLPVTIKARTIK